MRRYWIWLIVLFLLLRLYGLFNPLTEHASWRQADTASMAENILEHFSLFPQINYDGPPPNYAELEFPFLPLATALLWRVFKEEVWLARLLAIAFSLLSLIFLLLFSERKLGRQASVMAGIVYSFLPFNIFYNRTVMPEPVLLAFSLGSLYFFDLYLEKGNWRRWSLSTLFLILAILAKPNFLFLGLLYIYLLLEKKGSRGFLDGKIWLMALLSLGLASVYFLLLHSIAEQTFLSSLVSSHMLPNFLSTISGKDFWSFLYARLGERVISYPGLWLFALALTLSLFDRRSRFLLIWTAAALLFFAFSSLPVQYEHDYYHLLIVPPFSLAIGYLFSKLGQSRIFRCLLHNLSYGLFIFLIALLFILGIAENGQFWNVDYTILKQTQEIKELTSKGSLLVIDQLNPVYLFYADRVGWRVPPENLNEKLIYSLKEEGGEFLAVTSKKGRIEIPALKEHLEIIREDELLVLFKL